MDLWYERAVYDTTVAVLILEEAVRDCLDWPEPVYCRLRFPPVKTGLYKAERGFCFGIDVRFKRGKRSY